MKKTILSSKTGTDRQDSNGDDKSHAAGTGNNN